MMYLSLRLTYLVNAYIFISLNMINLIIYKKLLNIVIIEHLLNIGRNS